MAVRASRTVLCWFTSFCSYCPVLFSSQWRKNAGDGMPAWQGRLFSVMLYTQEGAIVPPAKLERLAVLRDIRAAQRAFALHAWNTCFSFLFPGGALSPSSLFASRELFLPYQPSLSTPPVSRILARMESDGHETATDSLFKRRHFLRGLAGCSFDGQHVVSALSQALLASIIRIIELPMDLWPFQVSLCFLSILNPFVCVSQCLLCASRRWRLLLLSTGSRRMRT